MKVFPPVSYPTAALLDLAVPRDQPDFMEEYEQAEDDAREREQLEEEAEAASEFTYPCPLKDYLA